MAELDLEALEELMKVLLTYIFNLFILYSKKKSRNKLKKRVMRKATVEVANTKEGLDQEAKRRSHINLIDIAAEIKIQRIKREEDLVREAVVGVQARIHKEGKRRRKKKRKLLIPLKSKKRH